MCATATKGVSSEMTEGVHSYGMVHVLWSHFSTRLSFRYRQVLNSAMKS